MNKPNLDRGKKKKIAVVILVISLMAVAFELGRTLASGSSTSMVGQGGVYPGAPSYTVWKESSTYYAKDAYGAMLSGYDAGSSNASQIVDTITTMVHGKVFFDSGTFTFTNSILLTNDSVIEGEGLSTVLTLANAANVPVVALQSGVIYGTVIRDLVIDGNAAQQSSSSACGIYINDATDYNNPLSGNSPRHLIQNVLVRNCYGDGIKLAGYCRETRCDFVDSYNNLADGFDLSDVHVTDGKFTSCVAGSNTLYGFYIVGGDNEFNNCKAFGTATNDGWYVSGWFNGFVGCWAEENKVNGFHLYGSNCYQNQLTGCHMDNNNGSAVSIDHVSATGLNRVVSCTMSDLRTSKLQTGITLSYSNYSVIGLNDVNYNNIRVSVTSSYYTQWTDNIGFKTHTSGTATISASTSVVVTHGLASTPSQVTVTIGSSGFGYYYVDTFTSTQFTIHVQTSGTYTCYWDAWCYP
jgi:hypothetical protein